MKQDSRIAIDFLSTKDIILDTLIKVLILTKIKIFIK